MIKSLAPVADGEKKNNIRFVAVIDHLVRSGWEFFNGLAQMSTKGV